MTTAELLLGLLLLLSLVHILITLFRKREAAGSALLQELQRQHQSLERLDPLFRSELATGREEQHRMARDNREELGKALLSLEQKLDRSMKDFNELQRLLGSDLNLRQEQLRSHTEQKLEQLRDTVDQRLQLLQDENSRKLEAMRLTVDEKLQSTLEKRFSESFTLISQRLEQVHKGLGEMQGLAGQVGDLRRVMSNVKSRGVLGEYQLANILEDLLTREQYGRNVKTRAGSGAMVEFAIRMPHYQDSSRNLWLPIDSKFPREDYEHLLQAYDEGDAGKVESCRKAFRAAMLKNARDISDKYLDPPHTTEYAILFLPFESLYAEVLRIPGLFEQLQKDYKVTITGPTTLSALLNSLQMGFRTLAIEKRSSEVWDLLAVVKKEFGQFGAVLEKTKKKLQEATSTIDQAGVRSRAIERQLREVQELPAADAPRLPGAAEGDHTETDGELPLYIVPPKDA